MAHKSYDIHFRVTEDEYKTIKKRCAEEGVSVSTFFRQMISGSFSESVNSVKAGGDSSVYSHRYWLRMTEKDYKKLQKMADQSNASVSDVVRSLVKNGKVPYPRTDEIREEVKQLIRIGNNLNQIAAVSNTYKKVEDELSLNNTISDLNAAIDEIMSRIRNE